MQIRFLMLLMIGAVIATILSIAVVQQLDTEAGSNALTPPDPLSVSPDTAAEQTR